MANKILLVDDSQTIRNWASKILEKSGFVVTQARDGAEAIRLACADAPDLVIVDVVMPRIDGYGVCDALKSMGEPWRSLPILFLTSVHDSATELIGRDFGAYLRKPAMPEQLLQAVQKSLNSTGARKQVVHGSHGMNLRPTQSSLGLQSNESFCDKI
ncbi:MAG TPA: response regulator [Pirellulaceae bacterium]|nr:response regulator [Pirellulaceae bacterium]HMO91936.1 response regulator [Pirellulaceae bacterium]HMP68735.1 response regulator [Pirellulaceae bacterium]